MLQNMNFNACIISYAAFQKRIIINKDQHIMPSQLKNILTRQIQWTIDWKRIWYGVASWKTKLSTWQLALGHCEK